MSGASRRAVLGTLLPGFVGTTLPDWVERMLRDGLAGVCLFGENVVSTGQLRELTSAILAANPAAVIAIDEEGGDVTRVHHRHGSPFPGNALLGRTDDVDATRAVAVAVGLELRAVGVNLDFAPDADINSNPRNPVIGVRSFGAEAALVARHTAAWTDGLQSTGVAASLKHFPGHGDTAQDSHLALPSIDVGADELRARELAPFAAGVRAGALTVMTSHILVPSIDAEAPATFSPAILQGLLRGELGFTGVIVSDALDMAGASAETGIPTAAVRALAAGCDLLCIGTKNTEAQLEEIVARVESAPGLDRARVEEAFGRVQALVRSLTGSQPGMGRTSVEPPAVDRLVAAFAVAPTAADTLRDEGWVAVRVDTEANIAVGDVPWGPFRSWEESGSGLPVIAVDEDGWAARIDDIPEGAYVLVVGKDNERRPWVRSLIDTLRGRHSRVVAVDMGWPGGDSSYAEVATFGASSLVGEALAGLLSARGVRA
ncbi:glycoside hydrolase family 3 protein [Herbiconiux liukaitaii]|uniref:glycoside hydrolase family 3 protein n=1 Tax=Herbiconiux liukaitaii TaxID=3342799 RepID=UPI0035B70357